MLTKRAHVFSCAFLVNIFINIILTLLVFYGKIYKIRKEDYKMGVNSFARSTNYGTHSTSLSSTSAVWMIASIILAIVGGLLIYFLFLNKKNESKFNGFLGWLYHFLSFDKMFLEILLKVTYLIFALYITLSSFSLIGVNFLLFLSTLVLGNILLRVFYEFSLIKLLICRNTTEISKNTKK